MTGHTKEPWEVQPYVEYGAVYIVGSDLGGLVAGAHSWPTEIDSGDTARVEANARRIVDCVNALAGIPDPSAYIAAARGMREALEAIYSWADAGCNGAMWRFKDQTCAKAALDALRAFDAAQGEQ